MDCSTAGGSSLFRQIQRFGQRIRKLLRAAHAFHLCQEVFHRLQVRFCHGVVPAVLGQLSFTLLNLRSQVCNLLLNVSGVPGKPVLLYQNVNAGPKQIRKPYQILCRRFCPASIPYP